MKGLIVLIPLGLGKMALSGNLCHNYMNFPFTGLINPLTNFKMSEVQGPILQAAFSLFSFLFSKNDFEFASGNRFSFYFQNSKTK